MTEWLLSVGRVKLKDSHSHRVKELKGVAKQLRHQALGHLLVVRHRALLVDDGLQRVLQGGILRHLDPETFDNIVIVEDCVAEGRLALGALVNEELLVEIPHGEADLAVVGCDLISDSVQLPFKSGLLALEGLSVRVKGYQLLPERVGGEGGCDHLQVKSWSWLKSE